VTRYRGAAAVLLVAAAIGAIVRSANASDAGRFGGISAAVILIAVGVFAWRGERWAAGVAFLLAVCWVWATLALAVQDVIGFGEAAIWLVWSVVVIGISVAGREPPSGPRFPPMRTSVGEDESDG
jgi:hypothetical protein